jgi:hypothetical protein
MSKPRSEFGKLWLESFCTFEGKIGWDEHACKMPKTLSVLFPNHIHIEPEMTFFYPTPWDGLRLLYDECIENIDKKYAFHLWEHCAWKSYLYKIDERWIKNTNSTYANAARRFL